MNEPDWFLREEQRLYDAVNAGEISQSDFDAEMRYLHDELRSIAEEEAERAYNDVLGGF